MCSHIKYVSLSEKQMFFWFLCSQKVCKIFCFWLFSVHIFKTTFTFPDDDSIRFLCQKRRIMFDQSLTKGWQKHQSQPHYFFGSPLPYLHPVNPRYFLSVLVSRIFSYRASPYVHPTTKSVLRLPEPFLFLFDLYYNIYYISIIIYNIIVLYFYYIMFPFLQH